MAPYTDNPDEWARFNSPRVLLQLWPVAYEKPRGGGVSILLESYCNIIKV
ncbi:protein of unknown function [Thermococcus camini]|uniref:Uncharacterized protein n=1 Tax=Thermococcus camini TaxID=2016373 RepID=A0A7G2DCH1_9EURY|nr:protein of unknown function [Thermococcus camini]